jgi:hypothetical protein
MISNIEKSPYIQDYMEGNICFGCGKDNPEGLQIKSYWEEDKCICIFQSQEKYQGWKNLMNGGILATVVLLGAGCNININDNTPNTSNSNETPISEVTETNTPTEVKQNNTETTVASNPISYTNPEFHFSLKLPATWTGYITKTTENDFGGKTVWFGLPGWDDIFAINVNPTEITEANTIYFGTDGQIYYYGNSAQYIKVSSLEARWSESRKIMDTFNVANLNDGTQGWEMYSNVNYNFKLKYPTTYKTESPNSAWPNSVVLFIEKAPGTQAYRAVVSVWNNMSDYTSSNVYSAMKYSSRKIDNKYVVISYSALNTETSVITEWTKVSNTLKTIN